METILITGANRGIGLALTRELLEQGATVIALARRLSPELESLQKANPETLDFALCDIDQELDLRESASKIAAQHSKIDVIVNNAAVMPEKGNESILDLDLSLVTQAFATNVLGSAKVVRAFFSLLRESGRPRILNVSSGLGSISTRDGFDYYPYAISKAALNMLTCSMAHEFRALGITTVAISPGWVRTDMGGAEASLSPEESAESLAKAIQSIGPDLNGTFLNRHGQVGEYKW
jgi:NAD(P)-dependent dehydrogenase (short-subunit alcohol dehydrogenase family)